MGNLERPESLDRGALQDCFCRILPKGSDVLVHSSLRAIGWVENGADAVIDALISCVGSDGNILMPAFSTAVFTSSGVFDVCNTPAQTGLISETFRRREGVLRSPVPMASVTAHGPKAKEYSQHFNSYLDETSPFFRLLENDGYIMLLGTTFSECTLFHLAEERHQVHYSFYKTFSGEIVTTEGRREPCSQRYFVGRTLTKLDDATQVGKQFETAGNVAMEKLGETQVRVFKARAFDQCCMKAIEQDPEVFLVNL